MKTKVAKLKKDNDLDKKYYLTPKEIFTLVV